MNDRKRESLVSLLMPILILSLTMFLRIIKLEDAMKRENLRWSFMSSFLISRNGVGNVVRFALLKEKSLFMKTYQFILQIAVNSTFNFKR